MREGQIEFFASMRLRIFETYLTHSCIIFSVSVKNKTIANKISGTLLGISMTASACVLRPGNGHCELEEKFLPVFFEPECKRRNSDVTIYLETINKKF